MLQSKPFYFKNIAMSSKVFSDVNFNCVNIVFSGGFDVDYVLIW